MIQQGPERSWLWTWVKYSSAMCDDIISAWWMFSDCRLFHTETNQFHMRTDDATSACKLPPLIDSLPVLRKWMCSASNVMVFSWTLWVMRGNVGVFYPLAVLDQMRRRVGHMSSAVGIITASRITGGATARATVETIQTRRTAVSRPLSLFTVQPLRGFTLLLTVSCCKRFFWISIAFCISVAVCLHQFVVNCCQRQSFGAV